MAGENIDQTKCEYNNCPAKVHIDAILRDLDRGESRMDKIEIALKKNETLMQGIASEFHESSIKNQASLDQIFSGISYFKESLAKHSEDELNYHRKIDNFQEKVELKFDESEITNNKRFKIIEDDVVDTKWRTKILYGMAICVATGVVGLFMNVLSSYYSINTNDEDSKSPSAVEEHVVPEDLNSKVKKILEKNKE